MDQVREEDRGSGDGEGDGAGEMREQEPRKKGVRKI